MPMITLASWNVNSVKSRLEHLIKWLSDFKPEVVLLQELKTEASSFPADPLEDLGYNITLKGQKTYNGVAILSKAPLEDVMDTLPGDENDSQARYIEAVTYGLRVASVYVPNGQEVGSEKFFYKMAFFKRLYTHIQNLLSYEDAFIIGGDYNVAPHPIDTYKKTEENRLLCSPQEREQFYKLMHLGLTNAVRELDPHNPHLYSWWDYRKGSWDQNHGFLIDHLLLSPQASDLLETAGVDITPRGWSKPSDHTPVWCRLNHG